LPGGLRYWPPAARPALALAKWQNLDTPVEGGMSGAGFNLQGSGALGGPFVQWKSPEEE